MHNLKISSKYVCPVNRAIGIHPACSDSWTNLLRGSSAHRCNLHFILITRTAQIVQIFQNSPFKWIPYYQSNNLSSVYFPSSMSEHAFLAWVTNLLFENILYQAKNDYLLEQSGNLSSPTWLIHLILIKQHLSFFYFQSQTSRKKNFITDQQYWKKTNINENFINMALGSTPQHSKTKNKV